MKILHEISNGNWLISKQHAGAYIVKAMQALQGVEFPVTRSLDMAIVSQSGVVAIEADTWVNDPSTIFNDVQPDSTVVIPVHGALSKYDNCGEFGTQTFSSVLHMAANNANISSVLLDIDSPGGTADGSYDMAMAVAAVRAKKPIIAYVNGLAASAGYRIAAQASMIVAKPGSIVGSIGTMLSLTDYSAYLEKMGVKEIDVYATASTDKNQDAAQAIAGNFLPIQESVLDPLNDIFLQEIRASRPVTDEVLTGKVYEASTAKALGLVDLVGDFQSALQLTTKSKISDMKLTDQIKSLLGIQMEDAPTEEPTPAPEAEVTPEEQTAIVTEVMQILEPRFVAIEERLAALEGTMTEATEEQKASIKEVEQSIKLLAKATKTTFVTPVAGAAQDPKPEGKRVGSKPKSF
jgi:signal peptide peptidase SppA